MDMQDHNNLYDFLDQYYAGQIDEEVFQERLQADSLLREAYAAYQQDKTWIRHLAKTELKEMATVALKEHPAPAFWQNKLVLRAAAACILAICAYLALQLQQQQGANLPQLYANYFELPPPLLERGLDEDAKSWDEVMRLYENKAFEEAIQRGEGLLKKADSPFDEKGRLYVALSYQMTEQSAEARSLFTQINTGSPYFQDAQWYLALSFLKEDNQAAAIKAFESILSNPRHFKYTEAKEILAALQ
jgi:hypothetical protein